MKIYYVTFGMGSQLGGYHATFQAHSEEIVAAFMQKNYRGLWSTIYQQPPNGSKPLRETPEPLFYQSAEHIQ